MNMEGWIKLYRKSLDSPVFKHEGLWKVWIWCLMKASHQDTTWEATITGKGSTLVQVERGQFSFGRNTASKELGMDPSTVYKRMMKLKKIGNLNIESNSHYSIVTIVNWDFYQGEAEKGTGKVTGKEQASNTYKNVKNEKKETLPTEQPEKQVDRVLTSVQQIVEAYKNIKHFQDIPNWDRVNFKRYTKAAKDILLLSGDDVAKSISGLKKVAKNLDQQKLTWTLETVVKHISECFVGKKEEELKLL